MHSNVQLVVYTLWNMQWFTARHKVGTAVMLNYATWLLVFAKLLGKT